MGYLGASLIILAGVLADFIAKTGNYKRFSRYLNIYYVYNQFRNFGRCDTILYPNSNYRTCCEYVAKQETNWIRNLGTV